VNIEEAATWAPRLLGGNLVRLEATKRTGDCRRGDSGPRTHLINTRLTVDGVLLKSTDLLGRPKKVVLNVCWSVLFTLVPIYEIASSHVLKH
jgi:hypothetical protein